MGLNYNIFVTNNLFQALFIYKGILYSKNISW
jgi:hypothetical protein